MTDIMISDVQSRSRSAQDRYGEFRSTHEALGVALEEWGELQEAIKLNSLVRIKHECIDLAAVLLRLAEQCESPSEEFWHRSHK